GNHVGGLWGKCAYDWLFVDLLAVPEEYRGENHGKALMERAEEIARANDCVGMWLDTFEFQARGFYEKLGFQVIREEDIDIGNGFYMNDFVMEKKLTG
ncbi:MAG: GNAT family N-acetyltransferase, partial [Pedobacter sp.]